MSTANRESPDTNKGIAKSAGVISIAILCSRILGFLRDVVIARLFGVYIYAQAFVIAFRIPNLFRDLVGEGAVNAAFVPVFSEYRVKHNKEEFWELANVVLNLLLVVLMSITVLGIVFSPVIVRLIAPGFVSDPLKLAVTIKLNRIIFPYILLISLSAYSMGILNSLKHFSVPAFAPCLLNISIIICALLFGEGILGLASGILIGGFLQLAVQIPVLYKKGFRLTLFQKFRHPAARTIAILMIPRFFSSCVYQLNNFVDSIFGSLNFIVGEGAVAILYYAYRLIMFPLGIFSTALSQAMLPTFSRQALEDGRGRLKDTLSFGLSATFFVLLPAQAGFLIMAKPIIAALFGGGKFDQYSVILTSSALSFYSIGLVFYGTTRVLNACFFSLKDTKTPAIIAFVSLILNITFNSILMFPLKSSGLALATSISGFITCLLLFFILKKKLHPFPLKDILLSFVRTLAASLSMAVVCFFVSAKVFPAGNFVFNKFLSITAVILISAVSYAVFCFIFGVKEIYKLRNVLLRV